MMSSGARYEIGSVVMSQNHVTSKLEDSIRQKLIDAGLKLHKGRSAIQCGHEPVFDNYPVLTPDILITSSKVAVEIDSDYTHSTEVDKDRIRNHLLAEVGWTVVRLRLGGLEPVGPYDVVSQSSGATKAGIDALVKAVGDAVAGRPGVIRSVKKICNPEGDETEVETWDDGCP
jgi:very-short-patch-repair endonuclease